MISKQKSISDLKKNIRKFKNFYADSEEEAIQKQKILDIMNSLIEAMIKWPEFKQGNLVYQKVSFFFSGIIHSMIITAIDNPSSLEDLFDTVIDFLVDEALMIAEQQEKEILSANNGNVLPFALKRGKNKT